MAVKIPAEPCGANAIQTAAAATPTIQRTLDAGQAARPQPATEEVARLNICRNRPINTFIFVLTVLKTRGYA